MVIEASWKPTQEGGIARRATVSTKPLSSAGLVSRASQKKRVSGGDAGVSLMEIEQQVLGGLHRNKQYSKSVVVKSKWEEVQEADSTAPPPKVRVPTEVQSRVVEKEGNAEVADSKASGIQASGGSQTFQLPLRSVPSNQAKIDNIAETAEPSWVAIARVSSFRIASILQHAVFVYGVTAMLRRMTFTQYTEYTHPALHAHVQATGDLSGVNLLQGCTPL